tara:strand:+ start:306 stop:494 length:189 start_codon:yes stop_codon:yes gene_type:complete
MNKFTFTDDEVKCLQVCLQNAPIPYDIEMKNIKIDVEKKIGLPPVIEYKGEDLIKMDLGVYQ